MTENSYQRSKSAAALIGKISSREWMLLRA